MRKHIILITTFGHSTFSNHCQVFSSVHPNNLEIDHPRQLCTTALNNSLNLIYFMLNQTMAECCYSFGKVVMEYFINFLIHAFRFYFVGQVD